MYNYFNFIGTAMHFVKLLKDAAHHPSLLNHVDLQRTHLAGVVFGGNNNESPCQMVR